MKHFIPTFLIACMLLNSINASEANISGSDYFKAPLASIAAQNKSLAFNFEMTGSHAAYDALNTAQSDVAIIADYQTKKTLPAHFAKLPFARMAAIVITHPDNPLAEIKTDEIREIFSKSSAEAIEDWSDLGLGGSWSGRRIQTAILENPQSMAKIIAKHKALKDEKWRSQISSLNEHSAILKRVNEDRTLIAISTYSKELNGAIALPISTSEGSLSIGPSDQSINYDEYPLQQQFYLYYDKHALKSLKPLLQVLYSHQASNLLEKHGIVPLLPEDRERIIRELDNS